MEMLSDKFTNEFSLMKWDIKVYEHNSEYLTTILLSTSDEVAKNRESIFYKIKYQTKLDADKKASEFFEYFFSIEQSPFEDQCRLWVEFFEKQKNLLDTFFD